MDLLILGVALAFGLVAQKISLPPLVGFLVAGFTLNAYGIESVPLLDSLTHIGVQLLLFSIGLKIDIKGLMSKQIWLGSSLHTLIFSIISILVFGLIFIIGEWLQIGWKQLCLIAFIMSFSSTICVVTLLEMRAELKTPHGQICLGILIMQDIFAVLFLTFSTGKIPSPWALSLLALPLAIPLLKKLLNVAGHSELLPLTGFAFALIGGALFEFVGLKADLGALIFGILLSQQSKATELAVSMAQFKDIFLIGFFLSIGFVALPTVEFGLTALLLTFILPVKAALFFVILVYFGVKRRSAFLSSLALTNFSEFGLIVAVLATNNQWLSNDWLVILAIAMSISFVTTALLNTYSHRIYEICKPWFDKLPIKSSTQNAATDINHTSDVLIVGMGRVGMGANQFFRQNGNHRIACVDADANKVASLKEQGFDIYHADAENLEFWETINLKQFKIILLALPTVSDLMESYRLLKSNHFEGEVCALAKYEDDIEKLKLAGIDAVFNLYQEAGFGLANHAINTLSHFKDEYKTT
jgi:glutathione-regulated potassium-efflux system ancillary protein KefC